MTEPEGEARSRTVAELIEVHKAYRVGSVIFHALRGVSLKVKRGDFLAVMGPSGSGKTTLLNILGLLDKPTAGRVLIDGRDVSKLNDRELAKIRNTRIGFVFQSFNLIGRLTVYENIEIPLLVRGLSSEERRRAVVEALLKAGGELSWLNKKPTQLSGGQQQRVAIARALVTRPSVILADEPTGNLDVGSSRLVMRTFLELNQRGETIVLVTHNPEVANCAKRIVYLRDGRVAGTDESPNKGLCIANA